MNKKVLVLTLILLAIPLLTITPVQAGKGQEKLYFKLYAVGWPDPETGERWDTPQTAHLRDVEWYHPPDVLEVTIGTDTYNMTTTPVYISYSAKLDMDINLKTLGGKGRARETITFSDGTVLGTLEILAVCGATFAGHGTGALEGVKVAGYTPRTEVIPWPDPPYYRAAITREGTIMGWPYQVQ